MKKIIFSALMLVGVIGTIAAQETSTTEDVKYAVPECPKVSHWSLLVKGGGHYLRTTTKDIDEKHNMNGFTAGAELEYTFNPLFGIGVDYTYNKFNRQFSYPGVGKAGGWRTHTHDVALFGSMSLTNLAGKYRRNQRFNLYVTAGIGAFWRAVPSVYYMNGAGAYMAPYYDGDKDKSSVFINGGLAAEYRLSNFLAINLGFKYNYYFKNSISGFHEGVGALENDRQFAADDSWVATLGFRFKFGRNHAMNVKMADYYPIPAPVVNNTTITNTPPTPAPDLEPLKRENAALNARVKALEDRLASLNNYNNTSSPVAQAYRNLEFDFNSARIRKSSYGDLDNLANILRENSNWKLLIMAGHTDNIGSDAYNQRLSERRVQAVKDYLINRGVSASNIQTEAYGESQPIASNATAEGRQRNRRVEFKITD